MPNTAPSRSFFDLTKLKTVSPFAFELLDKKPDTDAFWRFLAEYPLDKRSTDDDIAKLVRACLADEKDIVKKNLRILREHFIVRLIWQDTINAISLADFMREWSVFADECIRLAYEFAYQSLAIRYGEPILYGKVAKKDELAVIAMGKLGASELNLSSDIDLIFVHRGAGETDGKKCVDNQKFMTNLGRLIIELLDERTDDGFVFRVDMRLRPWGDGSPLVMSVGALEKYFALHGRTWERFAWLKGRIVNNVSSAFKNQLIDLQRNFVFRYYVDYSAFSALREMRQLISNQVAQREDVDNVKLGIGGIRDIEFIAQAFALIYGGSFAELTHKIACLDALAVLNANGLLDDDTHQDLVDAYGFLRQTEHRIQARHDTQTQKLPTGDELNDLAVGMGFANADDFLEKLNNHRQKVSVPFDKLVTQRENFSNDNTANDTQKHEYEKNVKALFAVLDDDNTERLHQFLNSKLLQNLSDEAKKRLTAVYPLMVYALLNFSCVDGKNDEKLINLVLPRLIGLLETIAKRSIYLIMLKENPKASMDLVRLLASGAWIASELTAHPVLLDTLLQKRYQHLPNKAELGQILQQNLLSVPAFDDENFLMSIRLFKKKQVLAVAESDILNQHPIMKVSDSLTFIGEVVLNACLERAFDELTAKHGFPVDLNGEVLSRERCGFAIVGYGKLGGIEMGYSSDLDVVFLHRLADDAMTVGENVKPIMGMKFATRLVQKLITYLTTQTRDGRVYELDMRLRPSGNAGVMVVSVAGFANYQASKAWAWEHQALVRARGICGDELVLQEFNDIRQKTLTKQRDRNEVKQEVLAMRQKMYEHFVQTYTPKADEFHLKYSYGGLIDIEFIAQYLVLAFSHDYPVLAVWSDNVRIFESVDEVGLLDKDTCQTLTKLYLHIRKVAHLKALDDKTRLVKADDWQTVQTTITQIWDRVMG